MTNEYTKYEVEKPFPGVVPAQEGATFEIIADGPVVLIQMPGLTREERRAFEKSFKRYAYLETETPVPIAVWAFMFPAPFGEIDCNFNARIVKPEYIENYMTLENGEIKNALQFFLLDGQILKGIKLVGLQPEAVKLFHATIRRQLSTEYSQAGYNRYLDGIFNYSAKQLFEMGRQFKK